MSGNQYGLTEGKSIIEAIERVMQLIGMNKGGEMERWDIPGYSKRIIVDHFTNRHIIGSYGQKIGIS